MELTPSQMWPTFAGLQLFWVLPHIPHDFFYLQPLIASAFVFVAVYIFSDASACRWLHLPVKFSTRFRVRLPLPDNHYCTNLTCRCH